MITPIFALGDTVEWTSQAAGYAKTKCGVVVEVVAPDARPDRKRFASLHRGNGCGWGRSGFSFVVESLNSTGRSSKFYWPKASLLRKIR